MARMLSAECYLVVAPVRSKWSGSLWGARITKMFKRKPVTDEFVVKVVLKVPESVFEQKAEIVIEIPEPPAVTGGVVDV